MRRTTASRFGFLITDSPGKRFPRKTKAPPEPPKNQITVKFVEELGALASRVDISEHIPLLADALSDPDFKIRYFAAEALGAAARRGVDMSGVVLHLARTLSDDRKPECYFGVTVALCSVVARDIPGVIPALVGLLERAAKDQKHYSSDRPEATLMEATRALLIAVTSGKARGARLRRALEAISTHGNDKIRTNVSEALFYMGGA